MQIGSETTEITKWLKNTFYEKKIKDKKLF